jgi:hypothetical protein
MGRQVETAPDPGIVMVRGVMADEGSEYGDSPVVVVAVVIMISFGGEADCRCGSCESAKVPSSSSSVENITVGFVVAVVAVSSVLMNMLGVSSSCLFTFAGIQ